MNQIHHKYVTVQGLKLHVADIGTGPNVVVFLHGFPEIWYSWRHQMIAVADAGFRAIAPDYRGYGLSDPPPQPEKTSSHDLINDLIGILDALGIPKVFLIGKDFGARPVYLFALLHPEKVLGVVTMGVPYRPPSTRSPYDKDLPEGFYINRWREPGRAEADFGRLDAKTVVRNVYILFSRSELPIAAENQEIMDLVDSSTPLPPWFTEEDLEAYGKLYEKSGFRTALQMPYRKSIDDLGTTESIVRVPVLFLMGEKDYFLKFPGIEHYINSGKLNEFVPDLEIVSLPEGTHFVQEQSPKQKMDQIQHKYVTVHGLNLHVADFGTGPNVVVFLHGFPEIWYSWRHQMVAVANAGFRAIAPDYRGYGLSDPPPKPEKTTFHDLINDLLGILDALAIPKVFLIAKDFGARPAYLFALLHPERVSGVVTMGVPYTPPTSRPQYENSLPEGFYINRWQEPGRAEADFGRLDAKAVVRNIYILFARSELPIAAENQEIMDLVDSSTPLPPWFTEEDLEAYGKLYEKSGFRTALQVPYRVIKEDLGITNDPTVKVPVLNIMGNKDYVFKFPGMADYINSGMLKEFVPDLEIVFLPEGTHFVQEQLPEQINELILTFLGKHI
ncbi:uncharacterized protein LOC133729664 isoform X2 [Rosa rugosa]|uniref:uncharacterized protein LOC133729664 isoform X2 n=1 Tax=Rosa rugosa TaxID=74645 RepID=UPI002B405674|nr:uncharacterized protein LOC133729664 isoform X2 [Rosa rugosa]